MGIALHGRFIFPPKLTVLLYLKPFVSQAVSFGMLKNIQQSFKACSKSETRSLSDSSPTDNRTRKSVMPNLARWAAGTEACVMMFLKLPKVIQSNKTTPLKNFQQVMQEGDVQDLRQLSQTLIAPETFSKCKDFEILQELAGWASTFLYVEGNKPRMTGRLLKCQLMLRVRR